MNMTEQEIDSFLSRLQRQVEQQTGQKTKRSEPDLLSKASSQQINEGKTMFQWSIEQLETATDGDLIGPVGVDTVHFNSVSTDTRTLQPGALYIAIVGENFDGHHFIEEAIKQGAVAVLVSKEISLNVPGVLVEDTRLALGYFAKWHRQQMPLKKLIAVTGSNGKTSVKTLLLNIFSQEGETLATEGNLNNDFGVPRTLLNLRPHHEYAIIEMGANHLKEISYLTHLALPDIAVLNNASGAHLGGFGSLQGVINTKGEIFEGLNQHQSDGVAILNTDSAGYEDWLAKLQSLGVTNKLRFGAQQAAEIHLQNVAVNPKSEGIEFELKVEGVVHSLSMPLLGQHNAMNAAACCAVALAAGLSWTPIEKAISSFTGVSGRLQKYRISTGWLIDDSYNANPESVRAGIDALCSLEGEAILCLGAMAEIGATSETAHCEVAEYAKQKGVKSLFVFGEAAKAMPSCFGEGSAFFDRHEQMLSKVSESLRLAKSQQKQINILVKGSRSAQMEKIARPLIEQQAPSNLGK